MVSDEAGASDEEDSFSGEVFSYVVVVHGGAVHGEVLSRMGVRVWTIYSGSFGRRWGPTGREML